MNCQHCGEGLTRADKVMTFNDGDVVMHYACGLRQVIGSLAHVERRCSCFLTGSSEGDPPGMTRRQAAEAALAAWNRQRKPEGRMRKP